MALLLRLKAPQRQNHAFVVVFLLFLELQRKLCGYHYWNNKNSICLAGGHRKLIVPTLEKEVYNN